MYLYISGIISLRLIPSCGVSGQGVNKFLVVWLHIAKLLYGKICSSIRPPQLCVEESISWNFHFFFKCINLMDERGHHPGCTIVFLNLESKDSPRPTDLF